MKSARADLKEVSVRRSEPIMLTWMLMVLASMRASLPLLRITVFTALVVPYPYTAAAAAVVDGDAAATVVVADVIVVVIVVDVFVILVDGSWTRASLSVSATDYSVHCT